MTNKEKKSDRTDEIWASFTKFLKDFKEESDRAAVIVGAAKLDLIMYQIIQRFLLPNPGSTDDLLEGDSPLSTFSAKINIMYRLGLIDSNFARALHLVRKIRNDFAHEVTGCDLGTGAHRDRVRELIAPFDRYQIVEDIQSIYFADAKGPSADFRITLAILIGRLEGLCMMTGPLTPHPNHKLILDRWKRKSDTKEPE